MADKDALRALQARLAERLKEASTEERSPSWLAVEVGGLPLLFPLQEAGEIFSYSPVMAVPHTQPWFLGVANLRGGLHGVVDLAAFLTGASSSRPSQRAHDRLSDGGTGESRDGARLVALNPTLECNAAVRVDRLAGLRHLRQLTPEPESDDAESRPSFAGGRYRDEGGLLWQEISLAALAVDPHFLKVVG